MTRKALRLLDAVDVTETDANGTNVLYWACYSGLDAVALRLLDIGGVDVDAKSSTSGTNVLWQACSEGLDAVALRLLDIGGVDVDREGQQKRHHSAVLGVLQGPRRGGAAVARQRRRRRRCEG